MIEREGERDRGYKGEQTDGTVLELFYVPSLFVCEWMTFFIPILREIWGGGFNNRGGEGGISKWGLCIGKE